MLLEGAVVNGAVVLDAPAPLPDGTRVRVEPIPAPAEAPSGDGPDRGPGRIPIPSLQAIKEKLKRDRDNPPPPGPTLYETYKSFIGCLEGLPADAATNHDHYIRHGLPKSSDATNHPS